MTRLLSEYRCGRKACFFRVVSQNPSLRRWMIPDPLSEKYYGISPYAFCNNNPVNLVDPDGQSPIYNISGHLIGTDDEGLQGDAIIMNDDDFSQGMSHSDAISHNLGKEGLSNQSAIYNFETSYASLCQRPDWDGQLTLDEAKSWYNNGIGLPLYVDSSKIDLGNFSISDLDGKNSGYYNTCTLVPTARNSFKIPESFIDCSILLFTILYTQTLVNRTNFFIRSSIRWQTILFVFRQHISMSIDQIITHLDDIIN